MQIEPDIHQPELPPMPEVDPAPQPGRSDRIPDLFKSSLKLVILDEHKDFLGGPHRKRKGYLLIAWSTTAAFIDALILVSLSCLFLVISSYVSRHLGLALSPLKVSPSFEKIFLAVFLMCSWIYMVTFRVLMGSSVGEWACDLRLGQPHERMKVFYPFKVILRESLIIATGFVVLPLLSLLCGRDLAGKISGLKLLSLK